MSGQEVPGSPEGPLDSGHRPLVGLAAQRQGIDRGKQAADREQACEQYVSVVRGWALSGSTKKPVHADGNQGHHSEARHIREFAGEGIGKPLLEQVVV